MAPLLAGILVVSLAAWCVAALFASGGATAAAAAAEARIAELTGERERLVEALRDLDMDLAMGKLSEADHAALKTSLETDAVTVLARLEEARGSAAGGEGGDDE